MYANSKDKNPVSGTPGLTPLHVAAAHGELDICGFIIGQVEDKNTVTLYGKDTPLHFAAEYGHLSVYKLLFNHAVDKNPKNNICMTPLHKAAGNGHLAICEFILKNVRTEVDINAKAAGNTALHYACRKGHLSVCKLLVENGADISITSDFGKDTPLEEARYFRRYDVVRYLQSIQDSGNQDFGAKKAKKNQILNRQN